MFVTNPGAEVAQENDVCSSLFKLQLADDVSREKDVNSHRWLGWVLLALAGSVCLMMIIA